MLSTLKKRLEELKVSDIMIPAEKVAHVQLGNPLEHALLVLVESGYSSVPVLDLDFKYQGTIAKTPILKNVMGMERYEMEKLSERKVEDVMNKEQPSVTSDTDFLTAIKVVIDNAFVCVVDEQNYFVGILTRRAILKEVNKSIYMNA
ncbi:cyclic-di-AMP-binding protein CbpB [Gracilibacillus marinus]|jgi:predicted transcriptional regulator|uniref:Cyclic-di-AMP-binding protein CbpB n=1 Tax=Gracilibacillus marinus TaxID=630535 RepID=A0ABV8VTL2_9BACI